MTVLQNYQNCIQWQITRTGAMQQSEERTDRRLLRGDIQISLLLCFSSLEGWCYDDALNGGFLLDNLKICEEVLVWKIPRPDFGILMWKSEVGNLVEFTPSFCSSCPFDYIYLGSLLCLKEYKKCCYIRELRGKKYKQRNQKGRKRPLSHQDHAVHSS